MQSARALGRIRGVLLDLSGTLHVESTPTPSAVAALTRYPVYSLLTHKNTLSGSRFRVKCRLRETELEIRFVTNTTQESKSDLVSRLTGMGFDISQRQIFTSLTAARAVIEREGLTPYLMLEDSAMEDFAGVNCKSETPNAVVVGLAPSKFDYKHLNTAFRSDCVYPSFTDVLTTAFYSETPL